MRSMNSQRTKLLAFVVLLATACSNTMAAQYRQSDIDSAVKSLAGTESERYSALNRITEMGPEAKDAVPRLIELLQVEPSMQIRGECAKALGNIGPAAGTAIPALVAFLQYPAGGYERAYVPTALGEIGQQPGVCVPVLIESLQHDAEPVVRQLSARALGDFGGAASEAVPALISAIKEGDKELREAAADALKDIPGRSADVPALIAMLSDPIDVARIAAARAVGGAGSEGVAAIPTLIQLLDDHNVSVRRAAAVGLGLIGPDAKTAIPALKTAGKDPEVCYAAGEAIRQIQGKH